MFTTGFPQEVAARYRPGIEMPGKMGSRDDIKLCHWVPKGSIFLKIDQNQLSFLFGFYLKKERKKIERKKVRARPLCHPRQPTHEPFRFIGHINASVP